MLVALGAAVGAPLRFHVATRLDGRFPLGTFIVNVVGSFLLGLFSALALDAHSWALLGTGFCGGLTTYSAFAVQTARLGHWRPRAIAYAGATIAAALGAAGLGFVLGS
ncbi:N/A [soil metagenome]